MRTIDARLERAWQEAKELEAGGYRRQARELIARVQDRVQLECLGLIEPEPADLFDVASGTGE